MKKPRGESEPSMEVHYTGVPGMNEERVAEIEGREQAEISETLTAGEVVDRLPSHIFESGGINRSGLIEALRHMDGHMREVHTDTVQKEETFPGGVREGQLFSIPLQVRENLVEGLQESGFSTTSNERGITAGIDGKTIVSFFYDSRERVEDVESEAEAEPETGEDPPTEKE